MSGITRLDEKHRRLVELRLRGVPWQQIADELGVAKSTVHSWWRDPLVIALRDHSIDELAVRRQTRLVPASDKLIELLGLQVDEHIRQMKSTDPAEKLKVPSIKTIVDAIQVIHGQERIDSGQRTARITETVEHDTSTGTTKRVERTIVERLLDGVVVDGEDTTEIDVTPEPKPEETE